MGARALGRNFGREPSFCSSAQFRRRLTWMKSAAQDIGVLGTTLAVIAITIFVGGALFALRIMPGPAFTLGAVATSVVILAVRRRMDGLRLVPRLPLAAQTGPACPSWSRCRRGRAGDCYLCRVDHRCCRRQCDPPGRHLASIFMGVDGRR